MDRRERRRAVVAVAFVAVAVVAPALVAARPANQIPVGEYDGGADLSDPAATAWERTPAVEVPLASAPSGLPNAEDVSTDSVSVTVAHTAERLYVRLSWHDPTADRNVTSPRTFSDAAAVQFPVNTSAQPAIAMGSTREPVNVWYWRATTGTEELLAGGPGTTTRFQDPMVSTSVRRLDDSWAVVYERSLTAGTPNRTSIRMDRDVAVGFAVWNGSNMERAGRKAVSDWYHLPLGGGPGGPPYESLLWAVAGLAIVVVIVTTLVAVRRTSA
ncbi:MAG: ethylbenzene dehydrogenase-related protein [Haloarculaceae archaeon]